MRSRVPLSTRDGTCPSSGPPILRRFPQLAAATSCAVQRRSRVAEAFTQYWQLLRSAEPVVILRPHARAR